MPHPDVAKRHEILIHAPALVVMEVARNFDFQSVRMIKVLFWLRARMLGAHYESAELSTGLVKSMLQIGWGCLVDEPNLFVAGTACRPWIADVTFSPIAPDRFADYSERDHVKILWTLEVESLGPDSTRFATETRVLATDDQARAKFRRYWRIFRIGIGVIRRILLSGVRREAERQWEKRSR